MHAIAALNFRVVGAVRLRGFCYGANLRDGTETCGGGVGLLSSPTIDSHIRPPLLRRRRPIIRSGATRDCCALTASTLYSATIAVSLVPDQTNCARCRSYYGIGKVSHRPSAPAIPNSYFAACASAST